ncbi:MAG TPA: hypothetical protein VHG30_00650 [Microvirga sp.]|nr:hypothetical protein [Microvirga sp.]
MSKEPTRPPKTSPPTPAEPNQTGGPTREGNLRPRETDPAEAARYIEAFALELSSLAKRSRLDFLAYLLDMARIEAERVGSRRQR